MAYRYIIVLHLRGTLNIIIRVVSEKMSILYIIIL